MKIDLPKIAEYFRISAVRDWKTARGLFQIKRYDACLFFCHLTLEKSLKYLVTLKIKDFPPYSHKLLKLAQTAGLSLTKEQKISLKEINTFNISGRYENSKLSFYKECNAEYTKNYLDITQNLLLWLQKNYPKK